MVPRNSRPHRLRMETKTMLLRGYCGHRARHFRPHRSSSKHYRAERLCCCYHINSSPQCNAVRGRRTGSYNSGVEKKYLGKKNKTSKKVLYTGRRCSFFVSGRSWRIESTDFMPGINTRRIQLARESMLQSIAWSGSCMRLRSLWRRACYYGGA